jgi:hypothetical protein
MLIDRIGPELGGPGAATAGTRPARGSFVRDQPGPFPEHLEEALMRRAQGPSGIGQRPPNQIDALAGAGPDCRAADGRPI